MKYNNIVNPRNRIDFKKLKYPKQIKIYQNPASSVDYDFNQFLNNFNNNNFTINTNVNTFAYTPGYSNNNLNVKQIENTDDYNNFTNYVLDHSNDNNVLKYLKALDEKTATNGNSNSLFTTDNNGNKILKNDWKNLYKKYRNDGKFGYYHLTPTLSNTANSTSTSSSNITTYSTNSTQTSNDNNQNGSAVSQPITDNIQNNSQTTNESDDSNNTSDNNDSNRSNQPYNNSQDGYNVNPALTFKTTEEKKRKDSPWTDWIPLSGILSNNLISNFKTFQNQIQTKFPLVEGTYNQGLVTNDYAARQTRSQLASNIRSNSNRGLTSNLDYNQASKLLGEQKATELENQNALSQTEKFNQTTQQLQAIDNQNKQISANVANQNIKSNDAAWNNILNARTVLSKSNLAELNSYIHNLYVSHGQWLQTQRKEDAEYQKQKNYINYLRDLNNYYESSDLSKLEKGIEYSNAFKSLKNEIQNNSSNYTDIELTNNGEITDQAIINYINTHSDNPNIKNVIDEYNTELKNAYDKYKAQSDKFQLDYQEKNLNIPVWNTNQGFRFLDKLNQPEKKSNPLYNKSGGSIDYRFSKYLEHYRNQMQFDKKEARKTQEFLQQKIEKEIGAIDKQTLLLLKMAFS